MSSAGEKKKKMVQLYFNFRKLRVRRKSHEDGGWEGEKEGWKREIKTVLYKIKPKLKDRLEEQRESKER